MYRDRSVELLVAEGRKPMEIYKKMKTLHGDYSCFYTTVDEWYNKFRQWRESTKDLTGPGPTCTSFSDEHVRQLEGGLGYNKVVAQWIAQLLIDE